MSDESAHCPESTDCVALCDCPEHTEPEEEEESAPVPSALPIGWRVTGTVPLSSGREIVSVDTSGAPEEHCRYCGRPIPAAGRREMCHEAPDSVLYHAPIERDSGAAESAPPTLVEIHVFHYAENSVTVKLWINPPGAAPPFGKYGTMADGSTYVRYTEWHATREGAEESAADTVADLTPGYFVGHVITHDRTMPESTPEVEGELLDPFTFTLHATMTIDPQGMGFDDRYTRSEVIDYGTREVTDWLLGELTSASFNGKVRKPVVNGMTMDDDGIITEGN